MSDQDRSILLPIDRPRLSINDRTDHVWSISFDFDLKLSTSIVEYASRMNTTLDYLTFTCYSAYLFKLTNGQTDLCIARNTNTHHQAHFSDSIHIIPFYLQLDPQSSFSDLLNRVTEMFTHMEEHTQIVRSSPSVYFDFCITSNDTSKRYTDFDLSLRIHHDEHTNTFTCTFDGSSDLFDFSTVQNLSHRFHILCQQLFSSSFDLTRQPIYELSIILPVERDLIEQLNNCSTISSITSCIHQTFIDQTMINPNKIAIILDEQSLTYGELMNYAQQLSFDLINNKDVKVGDIICQCVDRSLEMIVGIVAIMMSGGIYAPLNPNDSLHRLQSIIDQVNAKLVLLNSLSPSYVYQSNISVLNISDIINSNIYLADEQIDQLSKVFVTPDSISHIVFTSGSTGNPKAVQLRHRNFMSYINAHFVQTNDITLQLASASFDIHLDEIGGALVKGGTLILLKSGGHLDFEYVTKVIYDTHVTYVTPVPSWMNALGQYLNENRHAQNRVKKVRWWLIGGEQLLSSVVQQFLPFVGDQCHLFNGYGPAEITMGATTYEIVRDDLSTMISVPIGRALKGYNIYLLDQYRQAVIPGQQGEIIIGGVGVFAGYYGQTDLTAQVLMNINGDQCYLTGDIARLDNNSGELIFIGRRDFQVKLRGQRIELGHIEQTILQRSLLISACIVIKYIYHDEEHLLAYIETSSDKLKEEELRDQCLCRLPSYMIPSKFIILQRFPLTSNGKIDRNSLPSPESIFSMVSSNEYFEPTTPMEECVHRLWCKVLNIERISIKTSFFTLHGTSLLFMKLYNLYQIEFGIAPDIVVCLRHASISEHAQLFTELVTSTSTEHYQVWSPLHLDHAEASFAQYRIVLDEQIRFHSFNEKAIAIYNLPLLCRLTKHSLSIECLRRTLRQMTRKHLILRTSLRFDPVSGDLTQYIQSNDLRDWFDLKMSVIEDDRELKVIFNDEMINPSHFDVSQGRVFRCHIVSRRSSDALNDIDHLLIGDWIIFNFHHAAFDGESEQIFLDDLYEFYTYEEQQQQIPMKDERTTLQYIDYSIHERQVQMTTAKAYWRQLFKDYRIQKALALPIDRQLSSNGISTGQGLTIGIDFNRSILQQLLDYAARVKVTLYQVCLTIYYLFLFKLTGGQQDLLVGIVQANRYRPELRHLIGMFANTLPMRLRLDPYQTFEQLLFKVSNILFEMQPHTCLPYQYILEQIPMKRLHEHSFIQTMFTLDEYQKTTSIIQPYSTYSLNDHTVENQVSTNTAAMFDMSLSMEHSIETHSLRAQLTLSSDLFDSSTAINIAERFQRLVEQLFSSTSIQMNMRTQSMYDLSFIPPKNTKYSKSNSTIGRASFAQMRIWSDEQSIHNIPFYYQVIEGSLSIERLRNALQGVVLKHSSLRTSIFFDSTTNCLMQKIIEPTDDNEELFSVVKSTFKTDNDLYNLPHFDLSNGRVFVVHLFTKETNFLQTGDFVVFHFHPIVFDVSSWKIFFQDLCRAYQSDRLFTYDDTELRYLDYSIDEQSISMEIDRAFWHEIMFEYDWNHRIDVPIDHQHKESDCVYTSSVQLDDDIGRALINYASATGVSLLSLSLTCYYVFLFKLVSSETDFCVGMHVNKRYKPQLNSIIGTFINLIPLRFQLDPTANFEYSLHRVAKLCQKSFQHGHLPYQCILEELKLPSTTTLNISFDFQTNSSDGHNENLHHAQLKQISTMFTKNKEHGQNEISSKFDLSLLINHDEYTNTFTCTFNGSSHLFNDNTVQDLSHRFEILCQQLFSSSFDLKRQPIYELSIILLIERDLIRQLNNSFTTYTVTSCIHQAFVQQAILSPNQIAVTFDDQSLTFSELLSRVEQLAFHLINERGVRPGDIICQCVDRSLEMVVGIMGIMMSGGVYAPLSPSDSLDRLELMVQQVDAKLVLINSMSPSYVYRMSIPVVNISDITNKDFCLSDDQIDELSRVMITPDCISHIVFTSGSTGSPKAVQLRHRNFMSYMYAHFVQKNDITLQLASSSFDVHMDEIGCALVKGGSLTLLKKEGHLDLEYVTKVIYENNVTFITPVPSWMSALGRFLSENPHAQDRVKEVRWWFIGGEQLLSSIVQQFLPFVGDKCHILNGYGPAEATVSSTCYEFRREELSTMTLVPIAPPVLTGYSIHILDQYRQPIIPGQQGEIVVGGESVFAGYYGRRDLTEQVLIEINGALCYATGDLGRLDAVTGELYFIGRQDFQVKLRGQRIELSSIESMILQSSSDISNCIVTKEGSEDDSYLSAYIQVEQKDRDEKLENEIVKHCRLHLPSYMVPSKWLLVSEFPLTVNGKIDRTKLQQMTMIMTSTPTDEAILPLSSLERKIQDIFVRAFRLSSPPDVQTPFGQLGGTSLGAMHALSLVRQELFDRMDIALLFANPSVEQLAAALEPFLSENEFEQKRQDYEERDFSIRQRSSLFIETLGIIFLAWLWLWPIFVAAKFNFLILRTLFIPLIHLLQYPLLLKLFDESIQCHRDSLYSWRYYRLWFLRRQWTLNSYWLRHLLGTSFYNAYLRSCGASIGDGVHIYTTHIDGPWLLKIGDGTYIGDDVVLSSLSYHDRIYSMHQIRIGSHCSIGARCVLHDRVDIYDQVVVEPLTAVTGRLVGLDQEISSACTSSLIHSIFQLLSILLIFVIHSLVLGLTWSWIYWLPLCLSIPICWFIWSVSGAGISLLLLRYVVGHVEQSFSHSLDSWQYLHRIWLRQLIINSFSPCLSAVFDEFNSLSSLILSWLGAKIEGNDIQIAEFVPILKIPSNLLIIEDGVTVASDVSFVFYHITITNQCIITGPTQIGQGSFLGDSCVIQSGVCLPADVLIGTLTRVDSTHNQANKGDILLGVPAQIMPFVLPNDDQLSSTTKTNQFTRRTIIEDFQWLFMNLFNIFLLALCFTLSRAIASHFGFFLLTVPIFLCVYSSIVTIAYRRLIAANLDWYTTFAMTLYISYTKWIGCLLGGTTWLVLILRRFGARIGEDVVIDDMNTMYDVHLITVGSHTRLSATSQIQCHTFERRHLTLRPVTIGPQCILKPMSVVLPGVTFAGHNYLAPCSLALPHDQFAVHTNWSGSPTKLLTARHGLEPPRLTLAERSSSLGAYNVFVGKFDDDLLTLYFGQNGWTDWQSGIDLRRPFRPYDIYMKLFFTSFVCKPQAQRILIIGLGGGIFPILVRHYFPSVMIDAVEIDKTVIELACDFFGLTELMADGFLNIINDDAFHYVKKTVHRYDMIFIDAFVEESMPVHMNSSEFFVNLRNILTVDGCVTTNSNLSTTDSCDQLKRALSLTFESNIFLAHNNMTENARVIVSGSQKSLTSIDSLAKTVQSARHLEVDVSLDFSLSQLLSVAYCSSHDIQKKT